MPNFNGTRVVTGKNHRATPVTWQFGKDMEIRVPGMRAIVGDELVEVLAKSGRIQPRCSFKWARLRVAMASGPSSNTKTSTDTQPW